MCEREDWRTGLPFSVLLVYVPKCMPRLELEEAFSLDDDHNGTGSSSSIMIYHQLNDPAYGTGWHLAVTPRPWSSVQAFRGYLGECVLSSTDIQTLDSSDGPPNLVFVLDAVRASVELKIGSFAGYITNSDTIRAVRSGSRDLDYIYQTKSFYESSAIPDGTIVGIPEKLGVIVYRGERVSVGGVEARLGGLAAAITKPNGMVSVKFDPYLIKDPLLKRPAKTLYERLLGDSDVLGS